MLINIIFHYAISSQRSQNLVKNDYVVKKREKFELR